LSEPEQRREATTSVDALYRAHAPFVAGFLARLGTPRAELMDAVQEVFLIAHRRGGFVAGTAKPTTWLAEIAMRVASNARRARRRKPETTGPDALDPIPTNEPSPEQRTITSASITRVQECVEALDDDHRAAFLLYEVAGESTADIASALGVPIGTIHSRLHTARKRFEAAWRRLGARDGDPR
jgi:RNA polymerase sigma-70 factor (ECF subfamily)